MNSSHTPNADLAKPIAKAAADNARVSRYMDSLVGRMDRLVEATTASDWSEVRRVSENLQRTGRNYGCPSIAQRAEKVCDEMDEPNNTLEINRSVLRLIGACGREQASRTPEASS
jgi:hypothetical protein